MKTEPCLYPPSTVSFIPYALFKSALLWTSSSTEEFKVFLSGLFTLFLVFFFFFYRKETVQPLCQGPRLRAWTLVDETVTCILGLLLLITAQYS